MDNIEFGFGSKHRARHPNNPLALTFVVRNQNRRTNDVSLFVFWMFDSSHSAPFKTTYAKQNNWYGIIKQILWYFDMDFCYCCSVSGYTWNLHVQWHSRLIIVIDLKRSNLRHVRHGKYWTKRLRRTQKWGTPKFNPTKFRSSVSCHLYKRIKLRLSCFPTEKVFVRSGEHMNVRFYDLVNRNNTSFGIHSSFKN